MFLVSLAKWLACGCVRCQRGLGQGSCRAPAGSTGCAEATLEIRIFHPFNSKARLPEGLVTTAPESTGATSKAAMPLLCRLPRRVSQTARGTPLSSPAPFHGRSRIRGSFQSQVPWRLRAGKGRLPPGWAGWGGRSQPSFDPETAAGS